ncbi:MAG: DUF559 domain-containing protein [Caulobacter sp.]|nr:DUF559 domain-containing protein [Caulobacter sp.]
MPAPRSTVANARQLRKTMSLPETLLWTAIRGGQIEGFKFRRQHPIGAYVLDFYCPILRLDIEVDGQAHAFDDRPERDALRDGWLQRQGVRVLRIPARDILEALDGVIEALRTELILPPTGEERQRRGGGKSARIELDTDQALGASTLAPT